MAISKLQYEEAEIRANLDYTRSFLNEYDEKVEKYTYIRDLILKDRGEKRQRLEEIKRELNREGE